MCRVGRALSRNCIFISYIHSVSHSSSSSRSRIQSTNYQLVAQRFEKKMQTPFSFLPLTCFVQDTVNPPPLAVSPPSVTQHDGNALSFPNSDSHDGCSSTRMAFTSTSAWSQRRFRPNNGRSPLRSSIPR